MSLNAPDLTFDGGDRTECEQFVHAVKKHAFDQGKLRDNEWMADFASCCLTGDALRWHAQLPADVTGHWSQLQMALFDRFDSSAKQRVSAAAPAAAPPAYGVSRGGWSRAPTFDPNMEVRLGVIAVQYFKTSSAVYLSEVLDVNGRVTLTRDRNQAMRVCFAPARDLHTLHIPKTLTQTGTITGYTQLAITANAGWYAITCSNPAVGEAEQPSSYDFASATNETSSHLWIVSADGKVDVNWQNTRLTLMLILESAAQNADSERIAFVVDVDKFRQEHGVEHHTYRPCQLIFQSL